MDIIEKLKWRYAVKEFNTNRHITVNHEQTLRESILLTPSSYGLQPYRVVWIKDEELRKTLVPHSFNQDKVAKSNILAVICSETKLDDAYVDNYIERIGEVRNIPVEELKSVADNMKRTLNNMSAQARRNWAGRQAYIALGNLLTVAAVINIDACPMEGFVKKEYDKILELDKYGLRSEVIVTLGFRSANDRYQFNAKVRKKESAFFIDL
ncbi:MAG: NAD(P)H-dependent oxidoreductase [Bacteroidales bacterium]|jgi:nitroreductase|nr:NAD(P)H-dependent oxidoreductase [Bacteroidales bacterium]